MLTIPAFACDLPLDEARRFAHEQTVSDPAARVVEFQGADAERIMAVINDNAPATDQHYDVILVISWADIHIASIALAKGDCVVTATRMPEALFEWLIDQAFGAGS